ncbi:hypothetical protein ACFQ38_12955 [Sporosarcina contaminans]|uniref:Spore coat protein CotO n=1 Tax=Sporosarcina contaminans TaxID=633403 RepID=A0ABW3TZ23_9BACL
MLGAYTTEKGGIAITYKEPLLFISGPPPVFTKITIQKIEEESTSVFVMDELTEHEQIEVNPSPQHETQHETQHEIENPVILNKITYLSEPFQRQVYQPLQFVIKGEKVKGTIQKIEDGSVWINCKDELKKVEIKHIEEVLWRGHPFDRV